VRTPKKIRQLKLNEVIMDNPFITDEELAEFFEVSVQTIRLDRMELSIPELRERIKHVAKSQFTEDLKALPIEEVIGEIIDINLDQSAISILDVKKEHVFKRNNIARGHHVFAQANSLAVALINDDLALTTKATIQFTRSVMEGERVIAKAQVRSIDNERTIITVSSYVEQNLVFLGEFEMYRTTSNKGMIKNENSH
jgi:acyl-coenzyme A thioesterase PaaI-like protein